MFTRLFGRRSGPGQKLGFVEAQRMVLDYARLLEESAPMPGCIVDESRLPHPKDQLKSALLMCIGNSGDQKLGEHLRAGYMMLSAYQPGVGEQALGTNFASLDLEADPVDVAEQIERESEAVRHWRPVIEAELEALQRDLYSLDLDLAEPACLPA